MKQPISPGVRDDRRAVEVQRQAERKACSVSDLCRHVATPRAAGAILHRLPLSYRSLWLGVTNEENIACVIQSKTPLTGEKVPRG
jgi:hypothetical protein